VIPADWAPYERADDGELLGYFERVGNLVRPVTVFGHPLGEPGDPENGRDRFEALGLRYLAEPWVLTLPDRPEPVRVRILEASAHRVRLQQFFTEGVYSGELFTLEPPIPLGQLVPERPIR
jgi:hypothetical protein